MPLHHLEVRDENPFQSSVTLLQYCALYSVYILSCILNYHSIRFNKNSGQAQTENEWNVLFSCLAKYIIFISFSIHRVFPFRSSFTPPAPLWTESRTRCAQGFSDEQCVDQCSGATAQWCSVTASLLAARYGCGNRPMWWWGTRWWLQRCTVSELQLHHCGGRTGTAQEPSSLTHTTFTLQTSLCTIKNISFSSRFLMLFSFRLLEPFLFLSLPYFFLLSFLPINLYPFFPLSFFISVSFLFFLPSSSFLSFFLFYSFFTPIYTPICLSFLCFFPYFLPFFFFHSY